MWVCVDPPLDSLMLPGFQTSVKTWIQPLHWRLPMQQCHTVKYHHLCFGICSRFVVVPPRIQARRLLFCFLRTSSTVCARQARPPEVERRCKLQIGAGSGLIVLLFSRGMQAGLLPPSPPHPFPLPSQTPTPM